MYGGCSELQPWETEGKSSITKGRYLIFYMNAFTWIEPKLQHSRWPEVHLPSLWYQDMSYCSQASASRCISVFTTMLGWYLLSCLQDNNLQNLKNISMLRTCWRIQMVSQEKANTSCPRGENTEQSRRNVWAVLHTENLHHTVLCLTKTHCFICKEVSVTCRQKAWIIMKNSESETSDSQMYWRQIKSDIILIGAKKLVTELTQVIR